MPWGGKSKITVSAKQAVRGALKLRVPGWARNQPVPGTLYTYQHKLDKQPTVSVNGKAVSAVPDRTGYVSLERVWQNGDLIEIEFPLEVRQVVADSRVRENRGRIAIERGPIVYCAEWPEAPDGRALDLLLDTTSELKPAFDESLFGGVTVIATQVQRMTNPSSPPQPIRLIPYYLWANRGVGEMSVWLPTREYEPGDTGPALTTGRVSDIAIDPRNRSVWYVATASGGVWKTVNRGTTWKPIFDQYGSYSIGCVTLDPTNPDVVCPGTGENQACKSASTPA